MAAPQWNFSGIVCHHMKQKSMWYIIYCLLSHIASTIIWMWIKIHATFSTGSSSPWWWCCRCAVWWRLLILHVKCMTRPRKRWKAMACTRCTRWTKTPGSMLMNHGITTVVIAIQAVLAIATQVPACLLLHRLQLCFLCGTKPRLIPLLVTISFSEIWPRL